MSTRAPVPTNQSATLQTQQGTTLPEIASPDWEWVLDARGIVPTTLLGVLAYFAPLFPEQQVPTWAWIAVGTILILLWLLIPFVAYLWRGFRAVRARYRQYPIAREYATQISEELEFAHSRIDEIAPYVSVFALERVIYEPVGSGAYEMYVIVAKNEEAHLHVGDNLRVVDQTDDKSMGIFEVRQIRQHGYYAVAVEVDPNWEGYVRQEGRREQYPPPNAVVELMRRSN